MKTEKMSRGVGLRNIPAKFQPNPFRTKNFTNLEWN